MERRGQGVEVGSKEDIEEIGLIRERDQASTGVGPERPGLFRTLGCMPARKQYARPTTYLRGCTAFGMCGVWHMGGPCRVVKTLGRVWSL